jgi:predicted MFS family arabinose efflux permease
LERANGRLFAAEIVANQFAGPPLGGLLFAVAAGLPMLVDSATFVIGAVLVLSLGGTIRRRSPKVETDGIRAELAEGLRWLWRHRLLRTLALLGAVMNGVWTAGFAVLALFALDVLRIGNVGFGILLGASGVGYVIGSLGAAHLIASLPRAGVLVSAALSLVLVTIAIAVTSSAVVIGAALLAYGFASAGWDVIAVTLRQRETPDRLFGRVNSAYRFVQWGSMPLGAIMGGALADAFGLRAPWVVGGALVVLATLGSLPALRGSTTPDG